MSRQGQRGRGRGLPGRGAGAGSVLPLLGWEFHVALLDGARSGDGPAEIPATMSSVTLPATVLRPKSAEGRLAQHHFWRIVFTAGE